MCSMQKPQIYVEPQDESEVSYYVVLICHNFPLCCIIFDCTIKIFMYIRMCFFKAGPNVDVKKWQDEQIDKATVRFSAKDAKEKSKVRQATNSRPSYFCFCYKSVI